MYNLKEYERQRRIAEITKKLYPPGTRIELISMKDPYAPVPAGTRGTVKFVDSMEKEAFTRKTKLIPTVNNYLIKSQVKHNCSV